MQDGKKLFPFPTRPLYDRTIVKVFHTTAYRFHLTRCAPKGEESMYPLFRPRSAVMLVGLVALTLVTTVVVADDKTSDSKALDRYLYTTLRLVINHGVDLYNAGQHQECYAHFRQSLQDLSPVLSAHPDLQKSIKEALDKVEKDPEWRVKMAARATMPNPQLAPPLQQQAFALRAVFNDIRATLNPDGKRETPPPKTTALWDRLGGEPGVRKIVDVFADLVGSDPKVDLTRGGTRKLDELAVAHLKQMSIQLISAHTGGPLKYTGPSMKEAHKGMGITNEQFDATVADLKKALVKNNVKAEDMEPLLRFLETTRKDIVEGKKPETQPEDASVKGKVTLDGKPAAKGVVNLSDKDGKTFSAAIAADGTYSLEKVAAGAYKVAITNANAPVRFADAKTSGIEMVVKKGANNFDVELKGK